MELRHLVERDHAGPVERARRAVDGEGSVARLAHRDEAGAEEADISGDVGIDEVLGRRLVEAQSVEKLAPVSRRVDAQEGFRGGVAIAKSGEGEGDDLARPGDAGGVLADVGQHRTVAGRANGELDVGRAFDVDRLFAGLERPAVRRASGISTGSSGSTVSMNRSCTSVSAVVRPQAIESFWPRTKTGAPGIVAPLTDPSGVTMRARYQRIGALRSRCGSLARIGLPVSVRDPAITHSFDAPRPIPVKRADLDRRCFRGPRAYRRARAGS